jgi:hypothetical protein
VYNHRNSEEELNIHVHTLLVIACKTSDFASHFKEIMPPLSYDIMMVALEIAIAEQKNF